MNKQMLFVICAIGLSGCSSFDNAMRARGMEAPEVFRGAADQATLARGGDCSETNSADSKENVNSLEGTTIQPNFESVARAFVCATKAERAAYKKIIGTIQAESSADKQNSPTTNPTVEIVTTTPIPAASEEANGQISKAAAVSLNGNTNQSNGNVNKKSDEDALPHLLYWQRNLAYDAIAVANMNCDYHFRDSEVNRAGFEFAQSSLNTVATAIGAGLAALTSHNRAIFNLATSSTAANGIAANYKSTVFLTPVLRKLHKQLDKPRQDLAGAIRDSLTLQTMPRVMTLKAKLIEYEQLCSREYLVELLSQAADITVYKASVDEIPIQNRAEATQLIANLAEVAKVAPDKFTSKLIKTLWILAPLSEKGRIIEVIQQGENSKEQGNIAKSLVGTAASPTLAAKLNRIVVLLKLDDDEDLEVIKAALPKPIVAGDATKKDKQTARDINGNSAASNATAALTKYLYSKPFKLQQLQSGKRLEDLRVQINAIKPSEIINVLR
jgi:hypothetical protein